MKICIESIAISSLPSGIRDTKMKTSVLYHVLDQLKIEQDPQPPDSVVPSAGEEVGEEES